MEVTSWSQSRVHELGAGFAFLWEPKYRVDDPSLDVIVHLQLDVEEDRLIIAGLTLERRPGGGPVTMNILKSMPLVGLTRLATSTGALSGLARLDVEQDGGKVWTCVGFAELQKLPEPEAVAVAYRAAYFVGANPRKVVAQVLGLTHDVAAKRVQAARRAGLLEPTTKGRKGA